VNPAFLLDALAAAGDRQVVLEFDGPVSPLVLRGGGTDLAATFSLLMPVSLP
jgi:DNA polymerase III sliding clamp (beta) subunit (PCNA family)